MDVFRNLFMLEQIDFLIRTRATGPPSKLASYLNSSERNVYRIIGQLRDQGFPIAYDKCADTYYYTEPVRINFTITVGSNKLIEIQGGEKKLDAFFILPILGSDDSQLCNT